MTADNDNETVEETYVVNSAKCWAKADNELDALAKMAAHWHGNVPDTVDVSIVHCRGFVGMRSSVAMVGVDCDEVISETRFEIPREDFEELRDHVQETDLLSENCLVGNEA